MKILTPLLFLPLIACGSDAPEEIETTASASLPEHFYAVVPAEGAVEVSQLRSLEDGAQVTVRGDVQDFEVAGTFTLFDHALESCDEKTGESCATPWDFCCMGDDEIALGSALVELHEDGKLVAASVEGFHGIDHLTDVVVTGTLRLDDAGNARVLADTIHVE